MNICDIVFQCTSIVRINKLLKIFSFNIPENNTSGKSKKVLQKTMYFCHILAKDLLKKLWKMSKPLHRINCVQNIRPESLYLGDENCFASTVVLI